VVNRKVYHLVLFKVFVHAVCVKALKACYNWIMLNTFDEEDLNRLYAALQLQIETYNGLSEWVDEIAAVRELQDRIGKILDSAV
jgi:hypothetical protein